MYFYLSFDKLFDYLQKDNNIIISLYNNIYDDNKYILSVPETSKPIIIYNRKMSDYNKYLNEGHIIRYVYKKKIYYGLYSVNKRLINNKYRSLSAFVSEISDGRNKNGWGKCEKLEENGRWMSIDT